MKTCKKCRKEHRGDHCFRCWMRTQRKGTYDLACKRARTTLGWWERQSLMVKLAKVLQRNDPNFDLEQFVQDCQPPMMMFAGAFELYMRDPQLHEQEILKRAAAAKAEKEAEENPTIH